jgi:hypothetical protein
VNWFSNHIQTTEDCSCPCISLQTSALGWQNMMDDSQKFTRALIALVVFEVVLMLALFLL